MGVFSRWKLNASTYASQKSSNQTSPYDTPPTTASAVNDPQKVSLASQAVAQDIGGGRVSSLAIALGSIASIGGFIFGYESGQISGFLQMSDFNTRFGPFGNDTPARTGTIVGLLCIGTLLGCLASAWICDRIGRRYTISASAFFYIIGVVIEITSDRHWVQFAVGRMVAGLGIGALSTSVPMYQSESLPKSIRGAMVSSYQLLISLGIFVASAINYGTSTLHGSQQWRIPNGLSAAWAIILGISILFLPESPRFAYRVGRHEEARRNMARLSGSDPYSSAVEEEIREIEEKLDAERAGGDHRWYEVFTGPRMLYRTILGITLQAGQQLTGVNFFFYYGTIIFASTGIKNPFVTPMILGAVNVLATIVALVLVKHIGRRVLLMSGAAVMFMCFMVYSLVGSLALSGHSAAGMLLIAFTCIFIAAFAVSWGPLVWAITGELYPARYRASGMAIATASNWLLNFIISFFTSFIVDKINYWYGMVFGGCCFALFFIVFFFLIESKDRSLEEIDTMYVLGVNPITSARWSPKSLGANGTANIGTDGLFLGNNGREIKKGEAVDTGLMVHGERRFPENPSVRIQPPTEFSATSP